MITHTHKTLVDGRSRSPRRIVDDSTRLAEDMTGQSWRAESFDPERIEERKSRSATRGEREPGRRDTAPTRTRRRSAAVKTHQVAAQIDAENEQLSEYVKRQHRRLIDFAPDAASN